MFKEKNRLYKEKNRFIFFVSSERNFRQTLHTGDTLMKGLRRLKVGGGGFAKYTHRTANIGLLIRPLA